jgi:hypothetical protein
MCAPARTLRRRRRYRGAAHCAACLGAGLRLEDLQEADGPCPSRASCSAQVATVDLDNGPDCSAKFVSNKLAGGLLFGGILADRLLAAGSALAQGLS